MSDDRDQSTAVAPSRPSAAGYWIGGLVALVGVALGVVLLVTSFVGIAGKLKQLERVPVPGQRVLELSPGKHAIYVESNRGRPAAGIARVSVTDISTGKRLALAPYATRFTYDSGNRAGLAVHTFVTARAGRYRVVTSGRAATALSVTVGPPLGRNVIRTVSGALGGFGLLFLGPVAGAAIALITGIRRHRFDRATRPPPAPPAAGWYPDPSGQVRLRWWDGQRWTEHTS